MALHTYTENILGASRFARGSLSLLVLRNSLKYDSLNGKQDAEAGVAI